MKEIKLKFRLTYLQKNLMEDKPIENKEAFGGFAERRSK